MLPLLVPSSAAAASRSPSHPEARRTRKWDRMQFQPVPAKCNSGLVFVFLLVRLPCGTVRLKSILYVTCTHKGYGASQSTTPQKTDELAPFDEIRPILRHVVRKGVFPLRYLCTGTLKGKRPFVQHVLIFHEYLYKYSSDPFVHRKIGFVRVARKRAKFVQIFSVSQVISRADVL